LKYSVFDGLGGTDN